MVFQLHIPLYPLNQFIESFIYYKDYSPVHSVDRFLPDGNVNIVIDLLERPQYIYDNDTLKEIQACRRVWFSGMRTHYITIPSGRDSEMFIINFRKGRAYPFVQMPLNELTNSVVDGDLVLSNEIMDMREMILQAPLIPQKFDVVEKFLAKKFSSRLIANPYVDFAVNQIVQQPNQMAIAQIANKVGYSQKHLIKLFKDNVGLTPQAFLKIIRFQNALREIELSQKANWASIALESGYYDQAHFINDFKAFSGFTPNQYLQQQCDHLNYIPVG
jgi:AraC-like DNA-binding protein